MTLIQTLKSLNERIDKAVELIENQDKLIEKQMALIERMRNCQNCRNEGSVKCGNCFELSEWEIK